MGTNYYCETGRMLDVECDCGFVHRMPETLHIGKSSFGWKFTLHSIPEKGLEEWSDWEPVLRASPRIFDEYGTAVKFGELKRTVLHRGRKGLTKEQKERMRATAAKYGYVLDERKWLFGGTERRQQGRDGDYTMMAGEFS